MRVAIMQPYFFPYIGYWQLINAVDTFVIYDDVNYIKKGWVNRNRIIINGIDKFITIHLCGASQNKVLNDIDIFNTIKNTDKLYKTIKQSYKKSPFIDDVLPIIEKILKQRETNLAKYLEYSIREICDFLKIKTEIVISSKLNKNNACKGQERIIEICRLLGAKEYINPIGGQLLYSKKIFDSIGINLQFLKTGDIKYEQFGNEFIPNLSIIDVMMFNDPQTIKKMLDNYKLL